MFRISFDFDSERGLSGECAQMGRHSLDSRMDKQGQRGVAGKKMCWVPKKRGWTKKCQQIYIVGYWCSKT